MFDNYQREELEDEPLPETDVWATTLRNINIPSASKLYMVMKDRAERAEKNVARLEKRIESLEKKIARLSSGRKTK